jgi:hypothetical protein
MLLRSVMTERKPALQSLCVHQRTFACAHTMHHDLVGWQRDGTFDGYAVSRWV